MGDHLYTHFKGTGQRVLTNVYTQETTTKKIDNIFNHLRKFLHDSLQSNPQPAAQRNHQSAFYLYRLSSSCSRMPYKRNYTIYNLLCLAYFLKYIVFEIRPRC